MGEVSLYAYQRPLPEHCNLEICGPIHFQREVEHGPLNKSPLYLESVEVRIEDVAEGCIQIGLDRDDSPSAAVQPCTPGLRRL